MSTCKQMVSLADLPLGQKGIVCELKARNQVQRRLLDLGLITDTVVEALCQSPAGDPTAYQIRGAVIALRREEASNILVQLAESPYSKSWRAVNGRN
mgnify:CR=1 FL=1